MANINKDSNLVEKEKNRQDLGFGTKVTDNQARLIRSNGEFNVRRVGQPFSSWLNSYHRLITMHWGLFTLVVFVSYFLVNLLFAFIYFGIGIENLNGVDVTSQKLNPFWSAFFFSSQTLTTVGYGHISPAGGLTSSVASIEALLGLMMFAIITGLLYGRFAKPKPRISFSKQAIIAPYLDINGFMFRLVNTKSNQLINVKLDVIFSRNEITDKGVARRYYTLELERSSVKFFPMSWTVVHPITQESPFYGETSESLAAADTEILIAVEGTNDTYADPIYVRQSYLYNEITWGKRFTSMMSDTNSTGEYVINLAKISDTAPAALN